MTDNRALAIPPRQSENLLAQVIQAAKDPAIDAAKMETLARLVNSQQDREREIEFNQDKNAAIMEMPVITKDGRIIIQNKDGGGSREQGRFARFEDIDRVCRPILARHNLAVTFEMNERQGGGITVTPILSHANGMTERGGAFPVPAEKSGAKNDAQAMGSSASYGKRYSYCAILNIVTEGVDDDGNRGRSTTVHLPFERQQTVETEAKAAAEAGTYMEWFYKQSPKDRGWLVTQPFHAQFSGGAALPPPTPTHDTVIDETPPPQQQRRQDPPPPQREPDPSPQTKSKKSPRQWVDDFKVYVGGLQKTDTIDVFWDEMRDTLEKLKKSDPTLWQEANDFIAKRREDVEEGRLV